MESAEYKKQYDEYLARAEKALSQACERYLPEESDVCRAARYSLLGGGVMLGALFMATDYVTSPFTLKGKLVYGVALGVVTFAIRYWGSYTEGVSFALLFMNLWVPYINDLTRQTPYGYIKPAKKAKEGAGK